MKYLKLLLLLLFMMAMTSCVSYKSAVQAGYNPNDTDNIYHLAHE
ncbi:hypothetical protein [Flammeovirga kamogawensis]|nr:hypothetical protein [Flammeovirga kamogawensis]MBB6463412.1 HPt (histidine-containing phosphotransfer) domain-containing protein [Flammeovirga kamogawensis]